MTAYCVAEGFDLPKVVNILKSRGYKIDPMKTQLYPQVVHVQIPYSSLRKSERETEEPSAEVADVFIFPSGTVVAWALPESFTAYFARKLMAPAAELPHEPETEDLEYYEAPEKDSSQINGDTIVLGTAAPAYHELSTSPNSETPNLAVQHFQSADTVLTKIAFSSGLARSTKVATLERQLEAYFDATRSIPVLLSQRRRIPFKRHFILQKTGQLLSIRAQLNLYSELTDSLPDLFWDSRHELGLEGCYDQVGTALDVNIRIKTLNQKMDYAQEIATILRDQLSERHGVFLEWTIIVLITVEVIFEIMRLGMDYEWPSLRRATEGTPQSNDAP